MNTKTLMYIVKRVLLAIVTVWVVITVTFFVMHAVPGGPFIGEKAVSESVMKAMEAKYGLDKPLGVQYLTYLSDVVTKFDFGPSLKQKGRSVNDIIFDGMKTSAKLGLIAAVIALISGVILGSVAALRRNKIIDRIIMIITTAFVSMPSFIMGSLLLIAFAINLKWFPANGASKKQKTAIVAKKPDSNSAAKYKRNTPKQMHTIAAGFTFLPLVDIHIPSFFYNIN